MYLTTWVLLIFVFGNLIILLFMAWESYSRINNTMWFINIVWRRSYSLQCIQYKLTYIFRILNNVPHIVNNVDKMNEYNVIFANDGKFISIMMINNINLEWSENNVPSSKLCISNDLYKYCDALCTIQEPYPAKVNTNFIILRFYIKFYEHNLIELYLWNWIEGETKLKQHIDKHNYILIIKCEYVVSMHVIL